MQRKNITTAAFAACIALSLPGCNTIRGAGDAAAGAAQSVTHGVAADAEAARREVED